MHRSYTLSMAAFVSATALFGGGILPPLTPQPWDLTYGSNDIFTSTTGGTGGDAPLQATPSCCSKERLEGQKKFQRRDRSKPYL